MSATITFAGTGKFDDLIGQITVDAGAVEVSSPFVAEYLAGWVGSLPLVITAPWGGPIDRRLDGTDDEAVATVIAALQLGLGRIEATSDLPTDIERLVGPPDAPQ